MNKCFWVLIFFFIALHCAAVESKGSMTQPLEMRELCHKIQELDGEIEKLQDEIDLLGRKEKTPSPIIRNIYEIIGRCFTLLFDMQRFSNLLIFTQANNGNDFIKCSVIIKNFANYFRSINSQLEKNKVKVAKLKKRKHEKILEWKMRIVEYENLSKKIENKAQELAKLREENIIQNDVMRHLATKSESIEELDVELEAESTVGVLKNTRIAADLILVPPIAGKIIGEFDDRDANITFEAKASTVVTSPAKGLVVFSGKFLNYGNVLVISNGEYRVYLYGIDVLFSLIGDIVEIGDYIGRMRKDSKSAIKMELRKFGGSLDPRHWMQKITEEK